MAYDLFTEKILEREAGIVNRVKKGIEEWITAERTNPSVLATLDSTLLSSHLSDTLSDTPHPERIVFKRLIAHLHTHKRYEPIFESFYLSVLKDFYTAESKKLSDQPDKNAREFIVHCDERIEQEMRRGKEVLMESSLGVVRSETEHALLEGRLKWLAQDGMWSIEFRLVGWILIGRRV